MGFVRRRWAWRAGLVLLVAVLLGTPAIARGVLDLGHPRMPVPLGDAGDMWVDSTGKASAAQVAADGAIRWLPASSDTIHHLENGATLWVRFTVPAAPAGERWYLEVPQSGVNYVALHARNEAGAWRERAAGDSLPVASWPLPHRHPLLPVWISPDTPRLHLLQVRNGTTFSAPLQFVSESYLNRSEQRVSLALGMYFGLALLGILLAVIGAVTLRDPAYWFYALSVACMGLTQATLTGLAGLHLWPHWPWWNDMAPQVMPLFASATLLLFFAEVVSLRERSRLLYRLLLALLAAAPPLAIYMMFSDDVPERLRIIIAYVTLSAASGLGIVIWTALRGDRYAPWLLLGTLPVTVGSFFPMARAAGLIPVSFSTNHAMQVAIAIELPVLLIVLAMRSQHRREHVRRIQGLDRIDPATGLINAAVFHERLARLITRSQRSKVRSAMLIVDIANIEQVRRKFDNDAAREITLRVAGRLLSVAREIDTVARLSAHRFGILMEGPLRADEVAEAGPRIVARCLMPFPSKPLDWAAHVKVAQALIPMDGTDPAQLLGRLEMLLATAPSDSRRAVFMLSQVPAPSRPAALTP